ncbi:unnamed protein product [Spodoptera exigua]|nr:unnamed protein product [Spodoptera exigua]
MPSPDNRKQGHNWLETMVELPSGVGEEEEHHHTWTTGNNEIGDCGILLRLHLQPRLDFSFSGSVMD